MMQPTKTMPARAGILEKRGNMWLAWRQRYFVLKEGKLEYSKIGNTTPSGTIPLTGDWKVYPWKFPGRDHAIILKPPGKGEREYYLSALTDASKTEWIKDLETTIQMLKGNASSASIVTPNISGNRHTSLPNYSIQQTTTSAVAAPAANPAPQRPVSTGQPTTTRVETEHTVPATIPIQPLYPASSPVNNTPINPAPVAIEMPTRKPEPEPERHQPEPEPPAKPTETDTTITNNTTTKSTPAAPQKRSCCGRCGACCSVCCLWTAVVLVFVGTVFSAALATSKYDPESKVWGFLVSCYERVVDEINTIKDQVLALDQNYQIAIVCSVAAVLLAIVVGLVVCCYRRCRRKQDSISNHTFAELKDVDEQNVRQKKRKTCCRAWCKGLCKFLVAVVVASLVAVVVTSALDHESKLWNETNAQYQSVLDAARELTSKL